MSDFAIEARGLSAGYAGKTVVHSVDLKLKTGEILLMVGHNGAGKTTSVRAICGLLPVTGGSVHKGARDITNATPASNVGAGLAFVPQGHGVFGSLTVMQNIVLGAFVERDAAKQEERIETVFELFPILKERQKQIAGTMSGGQQQMLAIGMAMMHGPDVLILDEPSIGLAPKFVERVMQSITAINARFGTSILMVEQNLKYAIPVAQRAVVMKTGSIIFDGDPNELTDKVKLMELF
ncbi:MAG: ABC transporter ATP-binding protein [Neomegalonema sp.]|nr:ABC transporter ATP-binding protein [Neomegalonema sp.]